MHRYGPLEAAIFNGTVFSREKIIHCDGETLEVSAHQRKFQQIGSLMVSPASWEREIEFFSGKLDGAVLSCCRILSLSFTT